MMWMHEQACGVHGHGLTEGQLDLHQWLWNLGRRVSLLRFSRSPNEPSRLRAGVALSSPRGRVAIGEHQTSGIDDEPHAEAADHRGLIFLRRGERVERRRKRPERRG